LDWDSLEDFVHDQERCFVVDFTFDTPTMAKLAEIVGQHLVWIDHHQGVIGDPAYRSLGPIKGIRDASRAACVLTWGFVSEAPLPIVLALLGDRDTGSHEYQDTARAMHAFWVSQGCPGPHDSFWPAMLAHDRLGQVAGPISQGMRCLAYQRENLMAAIRRLGQPMALGDDTQVLRINQIGSAELGHAAHQMGFDLVHCWAAVPGVRWPKVMIRHSFYGRPGHPVNCLEIAQHYGGGGHVKAAGCETQWPVVIDNYGPFI